MQYYSTRDFSSRVSASRAIADGLAPDGGLYVPERIPRVAPDFIKELCTLSYPRRAARIMGLYLEDFSPEELEEMCAAAYGDNFEESDPAPLRLLSEDTAVLELWHGPTFAFKDMALQMLPRLLTAALKKCGETREVCILTATSGDTGKAALEGFRDVPGTRVIVFYPRDGVSPIQRLQMVTQQGGNVLVSAVEGNFDDAQTGVKKIFGDKALGERLSEKGAILSSANSMNWGRLVPQIAYYFSAYCDYVNSGRLSLGDELDFCVPTGNFGNILAGYFAARMGLPVRRFVCASNANNVLTDFIHTGTYDRNRPFHVTISPSMDILVSSNLERLLLLLCGSDEELRRYMEALTAQGRYTVSEKVFSGVREAFVAGCCDDIQTKATIAQVFEKDGYLMDPHTAVAYKVLSDYRRECGSAVPCVVVSTASPYKFAPNVLSALGESGEGAAALIALSEKTGVPMPERIAGLEALPVRFAGCIAPGDMLAFVEGYLS